MWSAFWTVLLAIYLAAHFIKDVISSCAFICRHHNITSQCGIFAPLKWARGPVAQTIMIELLSRVRGKRESVHRRVIQTDDGQDIVLDWIHKHDQMQNGIKPSAIVLILHGIGTDCYKACYVQPWHYVSQKLDIIVMNRRGHLPTHPLKPRMGNDMRLPGHADVEDIVITLDWLNQEYPNIPIFMVGYSSGANHALTTAGTALVNNPKQVRGIVALSAAVDLAKMVPYLEKEFPAANRLLGLGMSALITNNPVVYGLSGFSSNDEMKQAMKTMKITDIERAAARMSGKNYEASKHQTLEAQYFEPLKYKFGARNRTHTWVQQSRNIQRGCGERYCAKGTIWIALSRNRRAAEVPCLEEYWGRMSSIHYLKNINIPTIFALSEDDSLIPPGTAETVRDVNNPHIRVIKTKHGGHVGWIKPDLQSWAVDLTLSFIQRCVGDDSQ